ncbi:MAG: acetyl-CoA carboxylase biotin carboxyl carrier protein [Planctomycetes bacterium]|nr:acetyl-CoA carboxylase biotin carboxyl carrier protein [Planctomycetota bacterium]MBI3845830.1 acetyl-CoA carboxylase biotin carboxyl carrier protein [Planctomycetota bacterium]
MDLENLRSLIALMNENDLVEIEIEEEGHKVRLVKKPVANSVHHEIASLTTEAVVSPAPSPGKVPPPLPPPAPDTITINSPMVGTFYRSSTPDSEPYCEVGQDVTPDGVLCIIEAMKVMNEIKAETEGRIMEILVGNGEPVEYGQPLFVLKPAKTAASA